MARPDLEQKPPVRLAKNFSYVNASLRGRKGFKACLRGPLQLRSKSLGRAGKDKRKKRGKKFTAERTKKAAAAATSAPAAARTWTPARGRTRPWRRRQTSHTEQPSHGLVQRAAEGGEKENRHHVGPVVVPSSSRRRPVVVPSSSRRRPVVVPSSSSPTKAGPSCPPTGRSPRTETSSLCARDFRLSQA